MELVTEHTLIQAHLTMHFTGGIWAQLTFQTVLTLMIQAQMIIEC